MCASGVVLVVKDVFSLLKTQKTKKIFPNEFFLIKCMVLEWNFDSKIFIAYLTRIQVGLSLFVRANRANEGSQQ